MLKVNIKVDKLAEIRARTERRWTATKKRLQNEVPNYLYSVQESAQDIVLREAFDTGDLYRSIRTWIAKDRMSGRVCPDRRIAPYAEWVEFGHFLQPYGNPNAPKQWIAPVYYMARAMAQNRPKGKSVIVGLKQAFTYYDEGGLHREPLGRMLQRKVMLRAGGPSPQKIRRAQRERKSRWSSRYKKIVRKKTRIRKIIRTWRR